MPMSGQGCLHLGAVALVMRARPLEIGHQVLGIGPRHDLDEFPAVRPEVIEDRLGVVDEQRCGEGYSQVVMLGSLLRRPGLGSAGVTTTAQKMNDHRRWADLSSARLHVVSGKGGTGKTTVGGGAGAGACRRRSTHPAAGGRGQAGIARLLTFPAPYEERKVAIAPKGGDVITLAVDPEAALLEYLEMFYNMRRAGNALRRLGAIDFATTIAPGVRDVAAHGEGGGGHSPQGTRDASSTTPWCWTPADRPSGQVPQRQHRGRRPSEGGSDPKPGRLRDERHQVPRHRGSPGDLLEEMPVQETVDGFSELAAADLPLGGVFVNMVRVPVLSPEALAEAADGTLDTTELQRGLVDAGLGCRPANAVVGSKPGPMPWRPRPPSMLPGGS